QILNEENPQFSRYTAESDPLFHDNCSKTTREIMNDLIAARRELIGKIFSLKQEQLKYTGIHPVFGEMNLIQWLNFFLLHEAHHLFTYGWTIEKLKQVVSEEGITHQQFNILRILRGNHPTPLSTLTIRERMIDKMSDTSRIVDRLLSKGLAKKVVCKKDRRLVDVT